MEHLVDAIEEGLQRGLSIDAATREAFVRFGTPETVAAQFVAENRGLLNQLLFVLAGLAGLISGNEPHAGLMRQATTFATSRLRYAFSSRLD